MAKGLIRAGVTETPTHLPDGGVEYSGDINEKAKVNRYGGSFDKLLAMVPQPGTSDGGGFTVTKFTLKKKPGGQAVLEINYVKSSLPATSSGAVSQRIRISWARSQRPLRQHPRWKDIDKTTWAGVDRWEEEKDDAYKSNYQYRVPQLDGDGKWMKDDDGEPLYEIRGVSAAVYLFCDKRLNGVDSFDDFHPVVSRTRTYVLEPQTGACGKIDTANCPRQIAGYKFLKVADDLDNSGNRGLWQRTEQWEGFENIDTDLYTAVASSVKPPLKKNGAARK